VQTGLLRGSEHGLVGGVASLAAGRAAIALSRGGAAKQYAHRDPNEDAAAFADGSGGVLLAVADGHWGCAAAELALATLLARFASPWTAAAPPGAQAHWRDAARDALVALNDEIRRRLAAGVADWPRTTLALALVRPAEDWLGVASLGDSHAFRVDARGGADLADEAAPAFLGDAPERVARGIRAEAHRLAGTRALVLATDGLSERGIGVADPAAAVAECAAAAARAAPELRPLELARAVVERALAAQREQGAGDNVATAAIWIG
jgi:serine/threonine protein phosphatase PrpC